MKPEIKISKYCVHCTQQGKCESKFNKNIVFCPNRQRGKVETTK